MVAQGGGAVSYQRGTPYLVTPRPYFRICPPATFLALILFDAPLVNAIQLLVRCTL